MINKALEPNETLTEDRIDVSLDSNEVVIRLSTLVEGLGWCSQKTMRLKPGVLDELYEQISDIKDQLTVSKSSSEELAANVLAFPIKKY